MQDSVGGNYQSASDSSQAGGGASQAGGGEAVENIVKRNLRRSLCMFLLAVMVLASGSLLCTVVNNGGVDKANNTKVNREHPLDSNGCNDSHSAMIYTLFVVFMMMSILSYRNRDKPNLLNCYFGLCERAARKLYCMFMGNGNGNDRASGRGGVEMRELVVNEEIKLYSNVGVQGSEVNKKTGPHAGI